MLIVLTTKIKYHAIFLLFLSTSIFQQYIQAVKFDFTIHSTYQKLNNETKLKSKQKIFDTPNHALSVNKKNKQPRSFSESAVQGTELWSNAFNFRKTADTATDPRTGILSFHAKAGNLLSNSGHGPDIDLEIGYSSIAKANPDGLGYGWSWNLTHFNLQTNQLTTSTGQSFHLKQHNGQWYPLYHKLQDIHISGNKKTHFTITYANGLRETLNHDGYEVTLEQQDGWRVHFLYKTGTHLLQFITDDQGHSVTIRHKKNNIAIISKESTGQLAVVSVNRERGTLHSITLPDKQDNTGPGIYIRYLGHLIKEVDYPTGLQKLFHYNCTDAMKTDAKDRFFNLSPCVVSAETINPGAGQPAMTVSYQYSQTSANEHNYLAFNSGSSTLHNSITDILFEAPVIYTYRTQTDDGLIQDIRTYNKYHLLIDEKKISDRTGKKLSQVHTFFCNTDMDNGCAHTSFKDLPATYSLPLKIVTRLWSNTAVIPAITTETIQYDDQGRIVKHTDSFGRSTQISYCPEAGDASCPAMPSGWLFTTLNEKITTFPAKTTISLPFPVTIHNYYLKMVNYNNHGYRLVLDHQIQTSGKEYTTKVNHYYQNPEDVFTYGLLKKTVMSRSIQQPSTIHSIVHHYYYLYNPKNHTKTSYVTINTDSGKQRRSSLVTTSLFTNQLLQSSNSTGRNITRYHYDQWGRLIQKDFATDTKFAVSTYYHYTVSPQHNQLLMTTVNGLQQKTIFDGAGRTLMSFTEALTDKGKPDHGHWIPLHKTTYDRFGRIAAQYSYIIKQSGKIKSLCTTQDYDESGRITKLYLPDKQISVTQYDDAHRCVINYQLSNHNRRSAASVMLANILYQPVKILLLPGDNHPLPSIKALCNTTDEIIKTNDAKVTTVTYDGFGREISTTDPLGRIVKKYYNALGQVTDIMDPTGDVIHKVYDLNGHEVQSWAQPVAGGHYLLASAEYNSAGDLLWSAGEDGHRTTFTYTDDGKLSATTNPAGHTLSFKYNKIGLLTTKWLDGRLQLQLQYDPVTALVKMHKDITGITTFTYDTDGLVRQLRHSGENGYLDYQLKWQYDQNRRIISMTDIGNNKTQTTYDAFGRTKEAIYHSYHGQSDTLFVLTYDDFSRIKTLHYGSGMERTLNYDYFGHPLTINDKLAGKILSAWSFHYDADDNITTLIQQDDLHQYARLHYQYDALDNLVTMTCSGSSGLPLCPRDTALNRSVLSYPQVIIRQDYTFNSLNSLASVRETLQNPLQQQTLNKITNYIYSDPSIPLRLQQVSTMWNYQTSVMHHFSYDIAGNMTTDGEGNHIYYNAFNQIVQVTKADGQYSHYFYDSSGREVKTDSEPGTRYLFYRGSEVVNEKINTPGQSSHITGFLGVAKTTDGLISQYNESDYKGDVSGVLTKAQRNTAKYKLTQRNLYSPYGMAFHCNSISKIPLYQQTLHGFNGELTDPATGWQFLGNGHRTYNPEQRYFVSEDPVGDGYGFGSNNPIMTIDPDGNMPQWLSGTFKWMGYLSTFGLNALHEKWAHIAGAVITTGLTIATLGASAAAYGGPLLASAVVAGTAVTGSIPVVAAAIPANHGLNMAASIEGFIEMGAMIATAAVDIGLFFATPQVQSNEYELGVLNMLRLKTSKNPNPLYDTESPTTLLRRHASQLVNLRRQTLELKTLKDIQDTWKILKSEKNDLVACDAATLCMVSWLNDEPLQLQVLQRAMRLKLEVIQRGGKVVDRCENLQEDWLFHRASKHYIFFLRENLEKLNPIGGPFLDGINEEIEFDKILIEPGVAVIEASGHIGVIQRFSGDDNLWGAYLFYDDGTMILKKDSMKKIKKKFFSFAQDKNKKITSFMLL